MANHFGFNSTAWEITTAYSDRIKGRTVLVTGVSPDGLGSETVRVIAKAGAALVILASRTRSNVEEVIASVRKEVPSANLRFVELDLMSLESCRKAGKDVLAYEEPLHIVINNAALISPTYRTTKEGFESHFGANHLGHFVFTNTILPKMIETAKADPLYKPRIVNVSSGRHASAPIRFGDIHFSEDRKAFNREAAYGQSKTANILYTVSLADRLAKHNILSYSLHPGAIHTNGIRDFSKEDLEKMGLLDEHGNKKDVIETAVGKIVFKTLEQGAATHIYAAFSPDIETQSGAYLVDSRIALPEEIKGFATSKEKADRLWALSEELVGETYTF